MGFSDNLGLDDEVDHQFHRSHEGIGVKKRGSENQPLSGLGNALNEDSSIYLGLQSFIENTNSPITGIINSPQTYDKPSTKKNGGIPRETAIARYAFTAQKDKDLSFNVGDLITVEKKRNNGWWIGVLSNGKRGNFPTNYVELLQ